MKILFVENREKTKLWLEVAKRLQVLGHEIAWIIQNHAYAKGLCGEVIKIPYPTKGYKKETQSNVIEEIISIDRQVNHFSAGETDYFYYYHSKIEESIKIISPDLVIGESTAFHELIVIEECKKQSISYLNPTTCRYPTGRFSFYKYNTLEPFGGSGEVLEEKEALQVIKEITKKEVKPDYMKAVKKSKIKEVKDKLKKVFSYFQGERYNTPHPLVKIKKEKEKDSLKKQWDELSTPLDEVLNKSFLVLYPLQMQPESNIDVWGRKWRDQYDLVLQLSNHLPDDCTLVLKANPKFKHEVNEKMIKLIKERKNVVNLAVSEKMEAVFPKTDLVVTVTGTIAIECILSNTPCVRMVKSQFNDERNCVYIDHPNEIKEVISKIKEGAFPTLSQEEQIDYISRLNKDSYKGEISDPYSSPSCVSDKNIDDLQSAFEDIIGKLKG